jgi:hypothetical protein
MKLTGTNSIKSTEHVEFLLDSVERVASSSTWLVSSNADLVPVAGRSVEDE